MLLQEFLSRKKLSRKYRSIFGLKSWSCDRRKGPGQHIIRCLKNKKCENEGARASKIIDVCAPRKSHAEFPGSDIKATAGRHPFLFADKSMARADAWRHPFLFADKSKSRADVRCNAEILNTSVSGIRCNLADAPESPCNALA